MANKVDPAESGLTILELDGGTGSETLTLGDAPAAAPSPPSGVSEDLELAESLLVGNGKDANYYSFFGLRNFQELTEADRARMVAQRDRLVEVLNREWGSNEATEQRYNDLNKALVKAFTRLTQQKASFDRELQKTLIDRLDTTVDQYLRTTIKGTPAIDTREYEAILEEYEANGVLAASRPQDLEAFRGRVAKLVASRGGILPDLVREFLASLEDLLPRDFIDHPENRSRIAGRFAGLKEADWYGKTLERRTFSEAEVMAEVESILGRAGQGFRPKEEVFEAEVFGPFAARLGVADGGEIDSFNFGQLLTKARDGYFFADEELKAFCDRRGVRVKAEVEHKFNFGFTDDRSRKLEAKSYEEIVELFEEFPVKAVLNLYAGQLEAYLDNLGSTELRDKVRAICTDYSADQDRQAGLKKTIYTLLPSRPYRTASGVECRGLEELGDAIESKPQDFGGLLQTEHHEVILFLEARDSLEAAHEARAWIGSGGSPERRLNGVVWVLQGKVFKREGIRYTNPDQVVRIADPALRTRLSVELANPDSKFSLWIEESFPALAKGADRWRQLKRYNSVTLSYALEPRHPFHHNELRAVGPTEFTEVIVLGQVGDRRFLDALLDEASELRVEAEFWLREYHGTDGQTVLRNCLRLLGGDEGSRPTNDRIFVALAGSYAKGTAEKFWDELLPLAEELRDRGGLSDQSFDIGRTNLVTLLRRDAGVDLDRRVQQYLEAKAGVGGDALLVLELFRYFQRPSVGREFYGQKIQPLLEKAVKAGQVPAEVRDSQRRYFIEKYEQELSREDYGGKVATIQALKILDPNHALVRLYEATDASMKDCVRRANKVGRMKNALKRDTLTALAFLVTLGISAIPSLHKDFQWAPFTLDTSLVGMVAFWLLALGLPTTLLVLRRIRKGRS